MVKPLGRGLPPVMLVIFAAGFPFLEDWSDVMTCAAAGPHMAAINVSRITALVRKRSSPHIPDNYAMGLSQIQTFRGTNHQALWTQSHNRGAPSAGFRGRVPKLRHEIRPRQNRAHDFALHADAASVDDAQRAQSEAVRFDEILF